MTKVHMQYQNTKREMLENCLLQRIWDFNVNLRPIQSEAGKEFI